MRDLRCVRNEQRIRKRRADHSPFRRRFATAAPGREQPSGPASGRQSARNRGVAHAPVPPVTPAKCVSCAAQNAALVCSASQHASRRLWRDLREMPSGHPVHRPMVSTNNLAFSKCANHRSLSRLPSRRQPFLSRRLTTRVGRRSGNRAGPAQKCHQDLTAYWRSLQSSGGGDDNLQAWRERPRLWPRA